jgi:hypothetical protein
VDVVHYRLFGACVSFVPACTLEWCYDSKPSLWQAPRTDELSEVTCKECLAWLEECERDFERETPC